jgi:ArsR family transcriptional regulator, arsenate/arsenite/antimonite-responsive transcriptional repressor
MPRILELAERKLGERCCTVTLGPTMTPSTAQQTAADLDLLANPVRLQLLALLARNEGTVCVCDLEAAVPVKQPTVSHHLRLLREAGLVSSEKAGQWVYYRVHRERLTQLRERIAGVLQDLD